MVLSQSPYSASQSVVIRSPLAHGSALTSQSKTRALNRPVDRHREALALARYRVMCPARGLNPEPLDCESDTLPLRQVTYLFCLFFSTVLDTRVKQINPIRTGLLRALYTRGDHLVPPMYLQIDK